MTHTKIQQTSNDSLHLLRFGRLKTDLKTQNHLQYFLMLTNRGSERAVYVCVQVCIHIFSNVYIRIYYILMCIITHLVYVLQPSALHSYPIICRIIYPLLYSIPPVIFIFVRFVSSFNLFQLFIDFRDFGGLLRPRALIWCNKCSVGPRGDPQ